MLGDFFMGLGALGGYLIYAFFGGIVLLLVIHGVLEAIEDHKIKIEERKEKH